MSAQQSLVFQGDRIIVSKRFHLSQYVSDMANGTIDWIDPTIPIFGSIFVTFPENTVKQLIQKGWIIYARLYPDELPEKCVIQSIDYVKGLIEVLPASHILPQYSNKTQQKYILFEQIVSIAISQLQFNIIPVHSVQVQKRGQGLTLLPPSPLIYSNYDIGHMSDGAIV